MSTGAARLSASATSFRTVPRLVTTIRAVETGVPAGASAWDGYVASAIAEQIVRALAHDREAKLELGPRPRLYD